MFVSAYADANVSIDLESSWNQSPSKFGFLIGKIIWKQLYKIRVALNEAFK